MFAKTLPIDVDAVCLVLAGASMDCLVITSEPGPAP